MIAEKAIRFRHPDCNPDRAQKSITSSMSRHLSTRNILSKSMHVFLNRPNLANRQTDRQTNECGQKHLPPLLSEVISFTFMPGRQCSGHTGWPKSKATVSSVHILKKLEINLLNLSKSSLFIYLLFFSVSAKKHTNQWSVSSHTEWRHLQQTATFRVH